jgi:hypothetical protein
MCAFHGLVQVSGPRGEHLDDIEVAVGRRPGHTMIAMIAGERGGIGAVAEPPQT